MPTGRGGPTNADYNASWNIKLTAAAGNTYAHATNGYQGNVSADPGVHDFADQNTNLKAASYPGDTSTGDANGNPWPGGAPGIGAMGVNGSGAAAFLYLHAMRRARGR